MKKNSAPTMKDVAREAGVALGTVSKVINQIPVGEEYRLKVEQAIHKLNYTVNTYARGLKTQKTQNITLIISDILNPFNAALAHYIEAAAYDYGYKLILCCSGMIPEKEIEYLNLAVQNKTDGIIALTYSDIGNHIPSDIPLVTFDRYLENTSIPRVASDNFAGGVLAVQKLLEFGCKKPIFIRFHSSIPGEADKRKDGYLHACKMNGITPDYLDMLDCEDTALRIEEFILQHRLSDGSLSFDGIFANTDLHGYMAKKALIALGYEVPRDVQIIGFDGIHKFGGENDDLFVSSICQPIRQLSRQCVDIILKEDDQLSPSLTLLPITFRHGGTTREPN